MVGGCGEHSDGDALEADRWLGLGRAGLGAVECSGVEWQRVCHQSALVRGSGFRATLTWTPDSGASMSSFKRSQAKYVKQTHKITNWPSYDQALVNRGSLTFWFTDDAIRKWTAPPSGKAGGQRKYSDLAIETALAFRMVFHLPWRQTKGCLQSLVEIHGLTLEIPHHTTFSRRARGLGRVAFQTPHHE